jgi:hypothetical protein
MDVDIEISVGQIDPIPYTTSDVLAPSGLAAAANVGGGTFAAGTYYWVVTGTDAYGETTASNEASAVIALNGTATLTWAALPPGTTGVKVYRGTAPATENVRVATLGAVTTYTDTGTAGTGATPPIANTATIGNTVLNSGSGSCKGWSLRETSGSAPALLELQDGGVVIAEIGVAQSGVSSQFFGNSGIDLNNQLVVHVVSGVVTGVFYVVAR